MPHDPEILITLADQMDVPRERYLKWKILCERYERGKNSKLAECITKADGSSFAARESAALASEEFKQYLEEWAKADVNKVKSQVEFESLDSKFTALQSVLAYERDSMRRLG